MKLVIFMPALNEEGNIGRTIKGLPHHFAGISDTQVVVVDDGSKDRTAAEAREAGAIVVSHPVNKGVGAAFHSGLNESLKLHADILLTIDADGQFDQNDIGKMIAPILENKADFVTATRFSADSVKPEGIPGSKLFGNWAMAKIISWLAGKRYSDVSCGFRAYSQEAMFNLNLVGQFTYTQEVFLDLSHKGFRIAEVPSKVVYFKGRKSRVAGNLIKYAWKTSGIILRTLKDYMPMRFFGTVGVLVFILGLACDVALFWHYFAYGSFSPYIFLGFIGGALNFLGILVYVIGLLADMIERLRGNQEKILYFERKRYYEKQ